MLLRLLLAGVSLQGGKNSGGGVPVFLPFFGVERKAPSQGMPIITGIVGRKVFRQECNSRENSILKRAGLPYGKENRKIITHKMYFDEKRAFLKDALLPYLII